MPKATHTTIEHIEQLMSSRRDIKPGVYSHVNDTVVVLDYLGIRYITCTTLKQLDSLSDRLPVLYEWVFGTT